jgi:hypothetical protein
VRPGSEKVFVPIPWRGALVCHAEHDSTAALIGQCDAVFDQVVKGESAQGRLELDPTPFWAVQECAGSLGRGHFGSSARVSSSANR